MGIEELRIAFESKFQELEARAEAVDGFVRQQLQECCHSTENLGLMWQHLTTSSQRVEAAAAQRCKAIETRFDAELEALRACMGSHVFTQVDECCKSQERLNKFLGGIESGNDVCSEHDLSERLRLVSEKIDGMPAISPRDVELCNNVKPDMRALFAGLGAAASNGVDKKLHDRESLGEAKGNVLPTKLRQHQSKNFLAQGECQEIHDAAVCNILVLIPSLKSLHLRNAIKLKHVWQLSLNSRRARLHGQADWFTPRRSKGKVSLSRGSQ